MKLHGVSLGWIDIFQTHYANKSLKKKKLENAQNVTNINSLIQVQICLSQAHI